MNLSSDQQLVQSRWVKNSLGVKCYWRERTCASSGTYVCVCTYMVLLVQVLLLQHGWYKLQYCWCLSMYFILCISDLSSTTTHIHIHEGPCWPTTTSDQMLCWMLNLDHSVLTSWSFLLYSVSIHSLVSCHSYLRTFISASICKCILSWYSPFDAIYIYIHNLSMHLIECLFAMSSPQDTIKAPNVSSFWCYLFMLWVILLTLRMQQ